MNKVEKNVQEKGLKTQSDNIEDASTSSSKKTETTVESREEDETVESMKKCNRHVGDQGETSSEQVNACIYESMSAASIFTNGKICTGKLAKIFQNISGIELMSRKWVTILEILTVFSGN